MAIDPSLPPSSSPSAPAPAPTQPLRTTRETHPNLPPGLILDEHGKVCKVCNTWQDFAKTKVKKKGGDGAGPGKAKGMAGFAAMMGGSAAASTSSNSATATASSLTSGTSASDAAPPTPAVDRRNCPADTAELGRSTWTFLHTTAAYYPLSAPPKVQENMISLLSSLSLLYPCNWCATDFQKDIRRNPLQGAVGGRESLMKWLCERHNEVNRKLGKEEFGCGIKNLDIRWKDGPEDGSCD